MNSPTNKGNASSSSADTASKRKRTLTALALIAAYIAGAALTFGALPAIFMQKVLVVLLFEMIFQFPNLLAVGFHWLSLLVAVTTAFTLLGFAFGSLRRLRRSEDEVFGALRLRAFAYLAVGFITMCVFLASEPVAINGPFRVRHPVLVQLLATFILAGYAIWTIRLTRRASVEYGRLRKTVGLICMNLVVALVFAELVLRFVSTFVPIPILVTDESSSKIRRNAERLMPGELHMGFPVNREGHYDTELFPRPERSRPTVVSIGDSFSYGTVPHAYHYSTVVERENPGVEVYNLGFPGIGPRDYLHILEGTALPLEPDLVLIQIFASNDFGAGAPQVDPPRWYDADNYLLGILWFRWQILSRLERSAADDEDNPIFQDALSVEEQFPFVLDPMLETPSMGKELYLTIEASRARKIGIENPTDRAFFFTALEDLVATAQARGVPLAFVLIPDEFQVEDALWAHLVETSDVPLDRDLVLRDIVEWLEARGIPFLDLLPVLRKVAPLEDGDRHLYHLLDTHFNARGNEFSGIAMANFVETILAATPDRPARNQAGTPQTAQQLPEMSMTDAIEILRQFGDLIKEVGVNGSRVFDESLLNEPKDKIRSAILIILHGKGAAKQKAFAKEAAPVLAFFQPGIGKQAVSMDSMRSPEETWSNRIKEEMRSINRDIARQGQNQ